MHKVTSSIIIILKIEVPQTATTNSIFQTLKKVKSVENDPPPRYQKTGYGSAPVTHAAHDGHFMHIMIALCCLHAGLPHVTHSLSVLRSI